VRGPDGRWTTAENAAAMVAKKGGKGKKKAGSKGAKPKAPKKTKIAKAKLTPEQKAAQHAAKKAQLQQQKQQQIQTNQASVKKAMMDSDQGLAPTGFDNLMKLAAGTPLDEMGRQAMVDMGLGRYHADGTMTLTTYGRQAVRASNAGDAKAAIAAIESAPKRAPTYKSVKVAHAAPIVPFQATTYKSVDGQRRWLFVSSTAYQDRDGETVTRKALRQAVDLADQTGFRGNLRYWHLPSHLGTCDWQMVSPDGTLLYESGSFASPDIADWYEANKEQYLLSLGFRHPHSEPLPDKSFENMLIFERSLLPIKYTSNVFTGKVL
jgi:hypothetical protein